MRANKTDDESKVKPNNGAHAKRYGKFTSARAKKYHSQRQIGSFKAHRKLKLLTAEHLDGRSHAARAFNSIIARVTRDLGGAENLSEIEKHLVTSFAGAAILQGHQLTKMLSGSAIDVHEYATLTTAMIRSATRLGPPRQKDVTPSVADYVKHLNEQEADA
jgi:hypothetical protein